MKLTSRVFNSLENLNPRKLLMTAFTGHYITEISFEMRSNQFHRFYSDVFNFLGIFDTLILDFTLNHIKFLI